MASKRIVSCVALSQEGNPKRVVQLGGIHPDGRAWALSSEAAIAGIERGEWVFQIEGMQPPAVVTLRLTEAGERYLSVDDVDSGGRTLLDLPLCPGSPA